MAEVFIEENVLIAIGDAIRTQTERTELIPVADMANALQNVSPTGRFLWSKKATEDGEVIGYTTSNQQDKYPDSNWKNGYYWERIDT